MGLNPRTVNLGIIVPLTGADVDTWGEDDINPNMVALDGYLAGVQNIAVTGGPITLTAPAGFTATPSAGPTQAQNAVLQFTGVLTANVVVTLPLPGRYVVANLTTGNFQLQLVGAVSVVEAIALPQGSYHTIINDGSRVRFVDLGKVGDLEFWAGLTSMPAWVTFCSVPPYIIAEGGLVSGGATFPYLMARLGPNFGGNGTTSFGMPDLRGRVPLAYDATGARITVGGCGIAGTVMGAAGGSQSITLNIDSMPSHYHAAGIFDPTHTHGHNAAVNGGGSGTGGGGFPLNAQGFATISAAGTGVRVNSSNGLDTTYSQGGNLGHFNVQPAQVCGIWVVKT